MWCEWKLLAAVGNGNRLNDFIAFAGFILLNENIINLLAERGKQEGASEGGGSFMARSHI